MDLQNLKYWSEQDYQQMPSWAIFLLSLGSTLAKKPTKEARTVAAVALPTRAFAASFIAAGYLVTRFTQLELTQDAQAHFEQLCTLPKGAPLTYLRENRKLKAIFDGIDELQGQKRIRVQTIKKAVDLIPPEKSLAINIARSKIRSVPVKQIGKDISNYGGLLGSLLAKDAFVKYTGRTLLECVIVGQIKLLRQEITKTKIYLQTRTDISEGTLQEVLRVRRFLASTEPFRTMVVPSSAKRVWKSPNGKHPGLVVFDGPAPFIKCNGRWPHSDWVVVLDRTDPEFFDAVELVNKRYIYRLADHQINDNATLLDAVQGVAFDERWVN